MKRFNRDITRKDKASLPHQTASPRKKPVSSPLIPTQGESWFIPIVLAKRLEISAQGEKGTLRKLNRRERRARIKVS